MPFSVGAHPAFALPGGFEAYHLEFEQQEILQCFKLENSLISDESYAIGLEKKVLPLTFDRFKNDALVVKKLKSKSIIVKKGDQPFYQFHLMIFQI